MYYEDFAYDRTATRRKSARRNIRNVLGTSSDAAPTVRDALSAAVYLDDLIHDASSGMFRITVRRVKTDEVLRPVQAITVLNEIKAENEERAERVKASFRS